MCRLHELMFYALVCRLHVGFELYPFSAGGSVLWITGMAGHKPLALCGHHAVSASAEGSSLAGAPAFFSWLFASFLLQKPSALNFRQ